MINNSSYKDISKSIQLYLIGLILSIILTIIPFWIVRYIHINKSIIISIVLLTAVIQIIVHLVCFISINMKSNEGWNFISFIFMLIIVSILFIGSIWIMHNLNHNMIIF